jgi:hypothetical protein
MIVEKEIVTMLVCGRSGGLKESAAPKIVAQLTCCIYSVSIGDRRS